MKSRALESRLRDVAAFAEAGSDMCGEDEQAHARCLFEGAIWIRSNARLLSHADDLLKTLKELMTDYDEQYYTLTDGQYGKHPGTPAWKSATRLLRKLEPATKTKRTKP